MKALILSAMVISGLILTGCQSGSDAKADQPVPLPSNIPAQSAQTAIVAGPQGPQGERGPAGTDGKPGTNIAFEVINDKGSLCKGGGTVLHVWLDVVSDGKYNEREDSGSALIPICNSKNKEKDDE